eukprot:Polyplicarium_translucidae@DN3072_c0_g1_i1.p2
MKCLFRPALFEYEAVVRKLAEAKRAGRQHEIEANLPEYLEWVACLHHPKFVALWWNFANILIKWVLYWAYATNTAGEPCSVDPHNFRPSKVIMQNLVPKTGPSLHLGAIPAFVLEDFEEIIRFLISLGLPELTNGMEIDAAASASIFVTCNEQSIRMPHLRWTAGSRMLIALLTGPQTQSQAEQCDVTRRFVVHALIFAFVDAQKASYYSRIEQRLYCLIEMERLLSSTQYAPKLRQLASETEEQFTRFIHLFMESLSWLLDESMSSLAEIKTRECRVGNDQRVARGEEEDIDGEQERNVADMPMEQLEGFCKSVMEGALRSVRVLWLICQSCGKAIVESPLLLPQAVTCLNCCLNHLVGRKCLKLKVSNFEKYNFNPRELLAKICETYILLNEACRAESPSEDSPDSNGGNQLMDQICNECRFFKIEIFRKACHIIRREGIVSANTSRAFTELSRALQVASEKHMEEEEIWGDLEDELPEDFIDPIMQEIMSDPVRLPTSRIVVDRKHIERHLMSEEFDPFNRAPLRIDQLVPEPQLKERIRGFVTELKARKREERRRAEASREAKGPDGSPPHQT